MKKIKELHENLKELRKSENCSKKVDVVFVTEGDAGLGLVAPKRIMQPNPTFMSDLSPLYQGTGIMMHEQDENPYEFLTYKELNKLFKKLKEVDSEIYENSWLLIKTLDGRVHVVLEFGTDGAKLGANCAPLAIDSTEE